MSVFAGTSRFEVLRELGAGGMGVVYEALDRERSERIALKTLHHMEAEALFRFKKEFRSLHGMEHPNLIRLGELVEHEGTWFFTMELVDGEDFLTHVWTKDWRSLPSSNLAATMRAGKAAPIDFESHEPAPAPVEQVYEETRLRRALLQLAVGIQAVHDTDKVHRDIKPSNVIVARDGRVVLMDFGLVTGTEQHDRSTVAGLCGTPQYMAPEQITVGRVEPAADWYAFGVMLYEALTARLPIDGKPVDIMVDKLRVKPVPPSTFLSDVPQDLESLCLDLLRIEPTARPTGAEVLARLGGAERPNDSVKQDPHPSAPMLIGRPSELGALERAWATCVREKRAQTVLVTGPSGMGKSALLSAFKRHAQALDRDTIVFEGRGYEHETIPYNVFDRVIDSVSHLLRSLPPDRAAELLPRYAWLLPRLFPVLGRVGPIGKLSRSMSMELTGQELRARCFGAFRELLARIADRRPLAVLIDDVQWAGRDSLMLLGELVRPPEAPPMLLVLSSREEKLFDRRAFPGETSEGWWTFPADVSRVALGPLAADDARALASHLIDRAGDRRLDPAAVAEEAGGHPLFVVELVRYATLEGTPTSERPRLDEAIRARANVVDPDARKVLELIVVAGVPIARETLAMAAELSPLGVARALDALERERLARSEGVVEAFHNRVSEAVMAGLDPERRRQCHARLAAAYERVAGVDRIVLTRHLHGSGDVVRAARTAVLAAEDAENALAFDRAAELYRLALEGDGGAHVLRARLAQALALAGRSLEAADAYMAASEAADATTALDLRGLAARQYTRAGQFDRGMDIARGVLAKMGIRLPNGAFSAFVRAIWARFLLRVRGLGIKVRPAGEVTPEAARRVDLLNELTVVTTGADSLVGTWFSTRALLEALRLGEPARLARALGFEACWVAGTDGMTGRVARLIELVGQMEAQSGSKSGWTASTIGTVNFSLGKFASALEKLTEARARFAEQPGTRFELGMVDAFRALALYSLGRVAELRILSAASLRLAIDEGDRYHSAFHRVGPCNTAKWLASDDVARAEDELRLGLAAWSRDRFDLIAYLAFAARTEMLLYSGRADEAWSEVDRAWKPLKRAMLLMVRFLRAWSFDLRGRAAIAVAIARPDRRQAMLGEAEKAIAALEAKTAPAASERARLLRAGVAAVRGDANLERRELEAAMAGFDGLAMTGQASVVKRRLGVLRGGEAGKTLVDDADAWLRSQQIARPDRWAQMLVPRA